MVTMSSILIHGGDRQKREEAALKLLASRESKGGVNLVKVGEEDEKIGIANIKRILPHLHIRPSNKQKVVVIFEAQRLTVAAQNALLKILEEPPGHLAIILTVPNPKLLLPTVISRCLITELQKEEKEMQNEIIGEIFNAQAGQRLMLFEERIGYHRESVLVFLDEVEAGLKTKLNPKSAQLLIRLWQAKKLLRNESANVKLIIDELLLSW